MLSPKRHKTPYLSVSLDQKMLTSSSYVPTVSFSAKKPCVCEDVFTYTMFFSHAKKEPRTQERVLAVFPGFQLAVCGGQ